MAHRITDACNGCSACSKLCPVEAIEGNKNIHHVVDHDLCIECGVCGRICPEGAVTDSFGIVCMMVRKSEWERPRFDKGRCMSCRICIDACPIHCLALFKAEDTVDHAGYPILANEKACIGCRFCATECPVEAVTMIVSQNR